MVFCFQVQREKQSQLLQILETAIMSKVGCPSYLHIHASFIFKLGLITGLFYTFIAGVISLPYAEIKEPFEAWLDLAAKSSRIDYYHGKTTAWPVAECLKPDSVFSPLGWIADMKLRACCVETEWAEQNTSAQYINKEVKKSE